MNRYHATPRLRAAAAVAAAATSLSASSLSAAGSPYGSQVTNDFYDSNYDGPCPPPDYPPDVHHYVFTVYALDKELDLGSTNFPANLESVYQALIKAGLEGHVLATSRLVALNSGSLPPSN